MDVNGKARVGYVLDNNYKLHCIYMPVSQCINAHWWGNGVLDL